VSAPPLKKTVANCLKKRRFTDEIAARAAAMVALKEAGLELRRGLWVYRCPECQGWHLTRNCQGWRSAKVTPDDPGFKPTPGPKAPAMTEK
jgi:hypothetical protein